MSIKFDKHPLAIEQSNCLTKIVNVYIVYDLNDWPKYPINNLKFKNCLFGATNIVKNNDKEKYVYGRYGITFNSAGVWSFDNDTARNVIIFAVDNSSSSHSDNRQNNVLILGPTFGINGSFGAPEKKFGINFSKANTKFCCKVYIIMVIIDICLLMGKKSSNLKLKITMLTFYNGFGALESRKVSLNGNVYEFLVH